VQLFKLFQCLQVCGAYCCWHYIALTNFVCNSSCFFVNAYKFLFSIVVKIEYSLWEFWLQLPTSFAWKRVLHYVSFNEEDKAWVLRLTTSTFSHQIVSKTSSQELSLRSDYSKNFHMEHHVGNRTLICLIHWGFHSMYYIWLGG